MVVNVYVHSGHIKTFAKGIQYLAKLCEEFNIQIEPDRLSFKACNIAKSAYVEILMTRDFFEIFDVTEDSLNSFVRVKSKHCHQVFHSLGTIEKCALVINNQEPKVIFHLLCNKKIKKTYKLNYEDIDMLRPMTDNEYDVRMVIRPKIIVDALAHFSQNLEEISLNLRKDVIVFSTYLGEDSGKIATEKALQTEIKLDVVDFDEYHSDGRHIDLTFSFKEFKTLITFCETISHPITFYIKQNGVAMKFHTKYSDSYMVQFLIACFQTPSSIGVNSSATPSSGSSSTTNISHHQHNYNNHQIQQHQQYRNNNNINQSHNYSGSSNISHLDRSMASPHGSPQHDNAQNQMMLDNDISYYHTSPPKDFDNEIDMMLAAPNDYASPPSTMASGMSRANENPLSVGLRGKNLNIDDEDEYDEEDYDHPSDNDNQSVQPSQ